MYKRTKVILILPSYLTSNINSTIIYYRVTSRA
nr:MAG TPA: hypothetical protein [Caudoviricetes sp.]